MFSRGWAWLVKVPVVIVILSFSQVQAKEPVVLVVGDSISAAFGLPVQEGWVALMAKDLKQSVPKAQVVNASISGDTTQGGLARLPTLLSKHRPTLTIIELGGNDGLRGTPIYIIKENLKSMIILAKNNDSQVLLLGMQIPPNYGEKYTRLFQKMYLDLAKEMQVPAVPFLLKDIADKPKLMQADGIHPKAEAQAAIYALVKPHLRSLKLPK